MITTARSVAKHRNLIRAILEYLAGEDYRIVCRDCGADMIAFDLTPRVRIDGYLDFKRDDIFDPDHTVFCPRCDGVCNLEQK